MSSTHRRTPQTIVAAFGRLATHVGYPGIAATIGVDRTMIGRYINGEHAIPLGVLVEVVQTYQRQPNSPETAELARQIAEAHAELYGGVFRLQGAESGERRHLTRRAADIVAAAAEYAALSTRTDLNRWQLSNVLRPALNRVRCLVERECDCLGKHGGKNDR